MSQENNHTTFVQPNLRSRSRLLEVSWEILPPQLDVINKCQELLADNSVSIDLLVDIIHRDPIVSLEVIAAANTHRSPGINTVQQAIIHLGILGLKKLLSNIKTRPRIADNDVADEIENLRSLSRKCSICGLIIACIVQPNVGEIAQASGLFSRIGHMLACNQFGSLYTRLAKEKSRVLISSILSVEHGFDIQKTQLDFLKKRKLPVNIFYGLNRELKSSSHEQSALKLIGAAREEIIEEFEANRWDQYNPRNQLPKRSMLRLLGLSTSQYGRLYDYINAYLQGQEIDLISATNTVKKFSGTQHAKRAKPRPSSYGDKSPSAVSIRAAKRKATVAEKFAGPLGSMQAKSEDIISSLNKLCAACSSQEDLLQRTLKVLTSEGPFKRAALLHISGKKDSANIWKATGIGFKNLDGSSLDIKDPLSPLALCQTQLRSFQFETVNSSTSPFGATSFAFAPVSTSDTASLAIYADCGETEALSVESRKLFTRVINVLNDALKSLPV